MGRRPNVENLGLEKLGVKVHRGGVQVDASLMSPGTLANRPSSAPMDSSSASSALAERALTTRFIPSRATSDSSPVASSYDFAIGMATNTTGIAKLHAMLTDVVSSDTQQPNPLTEDEQKQLLELSARVTGLNLVKSKPQDGDRGDNSASAIA